MKKLWSLLIICFLVIFLSSCETYNSIVPNLSEWDGNYIYYGNKYSKTTGEDEVVLFDKIEYLDKEYNIVNIVEHSYIGDYLYFIFHVREELSNYDNDCTGIAKYNLKTKKVDVLHFLEDETLYYNSTWYYNGDYLIAATNEYLVRVSFVDDKVDVLKDYNDYTIYNECVCMEHGGRLYYLDINEFIINQIEINESISSFNISNVNGLDFITIISLEDNIYIYETKTKNLYYLYENTNDKGFIYIPNDYVIIGDIKGSEYSWYKYPYKNVLYQLEYEDRIVLKETYIFDEKYHIRNASINDEGNIEVVCYFDESNKNNDWPETYVLDVCNNKFTKKSDEKYAKINPSTRYVYGNYTYYIEEVFKYFYVTPVSTTYLRRVDNKGNIATMQFFSDHEEYDENKYYSSSFLDSLQYARLDEVVITSEVY